jgi:hypothetical protein
VAGLHALAGYLSVTLLDDPCNRVKVHLLGALPWFPLFNRLS